MNGAPISQTDLAIDNRLKDSASNGLSFMISLGRQLSISLAKA